MIRSKSIHKVFIIFVVLFFVSDFITNISNVYFDGFLNRFAGTIKLLFELLMIYYILKKRRVSQPLILGVVLFIAFIISNNQNIINISNCFKEIITNIYYFNRYLYTFIFIAFIKLTDFKDFNKVVSVFKKILYINSALIIIGFLFKIELFKSYMFSPRFGYDGIFSKHGEAAYYYMFFIVILYSEYLSDRTTKKLLKIIAISLVSIFLGKKAILLFLFFLLLTHFIFVLRKAKETGFGVLIIIAGVVFFKEAIIGTLFRVFPFWEAVYQEYGFISAMTSIRSDLLIDFINYSRSNWNVANYFFGMGEYERYKVEFEFIDLFVFFGLTGIIVFFYLFKKYFYNESSIVSKCLLLSILMTSFFSGALFISVTSMMFFYVIFQWINNSEYT